MLRAFLIVLGMFQFFRQSWLNHRHNCRWLYGA